jgi:peptidoglycan hydrolase-like protein with peptidoglycan-binding domain
MNKKLLLIVGTLCFCAFLCGATVSTVLNAQNESAVGSPQFSLPTFSFQKNLKFGDNNQDVRQLQIALNNDADTRVSLSGVGSKGQESTYFGRLTAAAVARFQAKYKISTTSFVGVLTRTKLNQAISTAAMPLTTPTSTSTILNTFAVSGAAPLTKEQLPRLYSLRPQQIRKGDSFTLVGAGFETENIIHIGSNVFPHIIPQDNNNISFTIPATANIQNGTYEVWVENKQGLSKVSGQPINLIITDSPKATPVILSVLPATIFSTQTVTITGMGFTLSDNDIISGFGTIKNVSSNGTQITFSPMSLLTADAISQIPATMTPKIDFYISNANGISNTFGTVNLKL